MKPAWIDRALGATALVASFALSAASAFAGVVNPDISVIGQPFARWTDDGDDPARKRARIDVGETEIVFDSYLNPYARGFFVLSLGEEGMELEEGYFSLLRGLPGGLTAKGGRYRVGFGKLNPQHPHAVPFADRPRVLSYLPGDEAFLESGLSLSERLPAPGDVALTASADVLQGDSFRRDRVPSGAANDPGPEDRADEPRPAGVLRLSAFAPLGDPSAIELGISGTRGTNNVAAGARTTILGADAKAKLWTSAGSYLLLQGELLHRIRDDATWDSTAAAYSIATARGTGGYAYADYNFHTRYNVGALYERFRDVDRDAVSSSLKAYVGFALLEESTAFRLDFDHFLPGRPAGATEDPDDVNSVTLRVIYSMGPHKAHQF